MEVKTNLIKEVSNMLIKATLMVNILDNVTVHTDAHPYDIFGLIVDLGSALGLWLGLFALSIFDGIVDSFLFCKSKCNFFKHRTQSVTKQKMRQNDIN